MFHFKPREHLPIVLAVLLLILIGIRAYLSWYEVPDCEWIERAIDSIGLLLGMAVAYYFKNGKE